MKRLRRGIAVMSAKTTQIDHRPNRVGPASSSRGLLAVATALAMASCGTNLVADDKPATVPPPKAEAPAPLDAKAAAEVGQAVEKLQQAVAARAKKKAAPAAKPAKSAPPSPPRPKRTVTAPTIT